MSIYFLVLRLKPNRHDSEQQEAGVEKLKIL